MMLATVAGQLLFENALAQGVSAQRLERLIEAGEEPTAAIYTPVLLLEAALCFAGLGAVFALHRLHQRAVDAQEQLRGRGETAGSDPAA